MGKVQSETGGIFAKVRMKIKILSWNVRGVNNPEKRKVIKQFIRDQRVDFDLSTGNKSSRYDP